MDKKPYWIALQQVPGIGGRRASYMLDQYNDIEELWRAPLAQLKKLSQIPQKLIGDFVAFRDKIDVNELYKKVVDSGCWVITLEDKEYPALLKEIHDPPIVLYGLGKKELLNKHAIAVVGTRKPSYYGNQMAKKLSGELGLSKMVVVSGMAMGVDTAAHWGALQHEGETVAVLGCGVNYVYPTENKKLYLQLINQGTIISEYLPWANPVPGNFPARNRIISGMSLGVLVIEAAFRSGALITADQAMEQGRDVFALPGLVTNPNAKGTHSLIKQGAKLVESVEDILEEYQFPRLFNESFGKSTNEHKLTLLEQQLVSIIEKQPVQFEELCILLNRSAGEVNGLLLELELKGIIKQLPGKLISCSYET